MTEVCSCCKTISGRRSRPRPPILSLEGPGGRQSYFKPKRHYLVLAASEASDQYVWGVFGCNFSWRFQWHHRRLWSTSAAGEIANLSPSTFSFPWQLPTSMASLILWPAINLSPVSLSRISPRIFEKIQNGSNGILGGLGDTDSWKKPEVENLVSDSL